MKSNDTARASLSPKHITGFNTIGLYTLVQREIGRFTTVYLQTIIAPVITTLLYCAVFALALGGNQRYVGDLPFLVFLAPGLIMMTMAQNAFTNTSSSLVIAKVQGNIVDVLMPPLSPFELMLGFISGGAARGLMVGLAIYVTIIFFIPIPITALWMVLTFAVLGSIMMGALGSIAGIYSDRFDHMAAFSNFFITPMTFLSGTFYSIKSLPGIWEKLALYNPFFYMIDGFRGGFIGYTDGDPVFGVVFLVAVNTALLALMWWLLKTGYKMKS